MCIYYSLNSAPSMGFFSHVLTLKKHHLHSWAAWIISEKPGIRNQGSCLDSQTPGSSFITFSDIFGGFPLLLSCGAKKPKCVVQRLFPGTHCSPPQWVYTRPSTHYPCIH